MTAADSRVLNLETLDVEVLGPVDMDPDAARAAWAVVQHFLPEPDQSAVLEMLFAPPRTDSEAAEVRRAGRPAKQPRGRFTAEGNSMPDGDSPEAVAYRAEVREWGRLLGQRVPRGGSLPGPLLDQYVATTGKRWAPAASTFEPDAPGCVPLTRTPAAGHHTPAYASNEQQFAI